MTYSTWDTDSINVVAEKTARGLGIYPAPGFGGFTLRRGTARRATGTFTIPEWVLNEPDAYIIGYIVHEVAHFARDEEGYYLRGHGKDYLAVEDRGLAVWDMYPHSRASRGNKYIVSLGGPTGQIRPSGIRYSPYQMVPDRESCYCGCGKFPKGKRSRFLPGHDMRGGGHPLK